MLMWNGACIVHDEFKGLELELLRQAAPGGQGAGASGVAAQRGRSRPTSSARPRSCSTAVVEGDAQRVHRRHRQRHPAPHAPARAGQDADRSAHRRQQRHLQELRALPVDGDERAARRARLPGKRQRRDPCRPEPVRAQAQGCIDRMLDFVAQHPEAIAQAGARLRAAHRRRLSPDARSSRNETLEQARERNIRDALMRRHRHAATGPRSSCRPASACKARVLVREDAVLCGRDWFDGCVHALDADGARRRGTARKAPTMRADTPVCHIEARCARAAVGRAPGAELPAIAVGHGDDHARACARDRRRSPNPRGCAMLDTRKTLPGLAPGAEVRGARRRRAEPAARAVATAS